MASLERAIEIAASSHAGQTDKAGQPYILHPLRIMMAVSSEQEMIVAVLHDVVEDTPWTLEELAAEGFDSKIIDAVDGLTKRDGETRIIAAGRARANPIARAVKIADVTDNMNLRRISDPSDADVNRLKEYEKVMELLLNDVAL